MRWVPPEDSQEPGKPVNAAEESARREEQRVPIRRRSRQTVVDGPFAESKELFGGQWPPGGARR